MRRKTKPKFDAQGYQTNLRALNREALPEKFHKFSAAEAATLGLPSLDQLAGPAASQSKVTLAIDDDAIAFFKREAKKRNTSYQRMIRNLLRAYAHARQ